MISSMHFCSFQVCKKYFKTFNFLFIRQIFEIVEVIIGEKGNWRLAFQWQSTKSYKHEYEIIQACVRNHTSTSAKSYKHKYEITQAWVQNHTSMSTKSHKHGHEIIQAWVRNHTSMGTKSYKHGYKIIQRWVRNHASIGTKSYKHGYEITQAWVRNHTSMGTKSYKHGYEIIQAWVRNHTSMSTKSYKHGPFKCKNILIYQIFVTYLTKWDILLKNEKSCWKMSSSKKYRIGPWNFLAKVKFSSQNYSYFKS